MAKKLGALLGVGIITWVIAVTFFPQTAVSLPAAVVFAVVGLLAFIWALRYRGII